MDKVFIIVYLTLLILINVMVGVYLIQWNYFPSLVYFVVMQLFNVQFVYTLTEMLLSLIVRRNHDLPHLDSLPHTPAVALLYLTCDDANPKILETLAYQTYPNYHVFVLDNSASPKYRALIDSCPFQVVRHQRRHKAGAISNWLHEHGRNFSYFVTLDSDSIIPPDFVTQMVRYAEHPLNGKVAIFQSRTRAWNVGNRFVRTLAVMESVWYFPLERLANRCNMLLNWGHNILCRTEAVLLAGGYAEGFLSEDYEVAVRLLQVGYSNKLVDVLSWDAMPEDADSYAERLVRWAQGTLQVVMRDVGAIPLIVKFRLCMALYFYLIQVLYIVALFLIVWSYQSSLRSVYVLSQFILSGAFLKTPFWRPLAVIGLYLSFYLVVQPLWARRLGVSFRQYYLHSALGVALCVYSFIPLVRDAGYTLCTGKGEWRIMPKPGTDMVVRQPIQRWIATFILSAVMWVGLIRNPVSFVFNFMWLLPFLVAPLVLYWFREPPDQALTGVTPTVARLYPTFVEPLY